MLLRTQFVELGAALMDTVNGLHYTFLDTRRKTTRPLVNQARRIVSFFEKKGINRTQVVVCVNFLEIALVNKTWLINCIDTGV